ncbi:hypothetical protein AMATHDRAFT_8665 [Amanita thiersii Skay4041]|uniref:Flavin reductase like domain-containing protein n=1 Tax=Amanita thiersii Skay4041 TaxID=703135 RepID=A0A2A9NC01_9AGAR|nr:hypothetical protein AMATHDRAFT_8665 [Amanita thiersii Skay4041]
MSTSGDQSSLPPYKPSTGFHLTQKPNPSWMYGQKTETTPEGKKWMKGVKSGWKVVDATVEDPRKLYGLLLTGIAPRPVAFVSSVSKTGVKNLAPFSWFNQVTSDPPVISVSCVNYSTRSKDTAQNIKDTKGFTVNIISEPWIEQANVCGIDAPPEISEWDISGLSMEPSISVAAPRVRECAFSIECELLQAIDIMDPKSNIAKGCLILGSVKYIHVRNDVLDERGYADPGKLLPIARMGSITYGAMREGFQIPRHSWEKERDDIMQALAPPSKSAAL